MNHKVRLLIVSVGLIVACWVAFAITASQQGDEPQIRAVPLVARAYKVVMARPLEDAELATLVEIVRPRFTIRRIPLSLVYHCIRLFGREGTLELGELKENGIHWSAGPKLVDIVTEHKKFEKFVAFSLTELHTNSDWGIQTASSSDFSESARRGSSHVGKFHDTMAKIGLPSSYPLYLADGSRSDLAAAVRDEAMRYHPDVETEWVVQALCSYLASPVWRDRFRHSRHLNDIVVRLVDRPLGEGSCNGIHVIHALSWAIEIHRQSPFLTAESESRILNRLRVVSLLLDRTQQANGCWSVNWERDGHDNLGPSRVSFYSDPTIADIDIVGHHLEWISTCPDSIRPKPQTIEKAIRYLVQAIPRVRATVSDDWHNFLPTSHAVRSLLLLTRGTAEDPMQFLNPNSTPFDIKPSGRQTLQRR